MNRERLKIIIKFILFLAFMSAVIAIQMCEKKTGIDNIIYLLKNNSDE